MLTVPTMPPSSANASPRTRVVAGAVFDAVWGAPGAAVEPDACATARASPVGAPGCTRVMSRSSRLSWGPSAGRANASEGPMPGGSETAPVLVRAEPRT